MQKMNKKGQVMNQLSGLAIGGVTLAIILVVVFLILSNLAANTTVAADSNATAAIRAVQTASATIPTWIALIFLVFIGGILIFLVSRGFGGGR